MSPRFATTRWSVVLAARDGSEAEARDALEELCRSYWYPLYTYIRSRGHAPEEAADLTQGFFAELLEKDLLQAIDRDKGRFRSFLLGALKFYISHERDKTRTLKRGGGTRVLSLDADAAENRYRHEPTEDLTPEQVFERRWGLTVMERAMERLEAASLGADVGGERFARLKPFLTGSESELPYRDVAEELGTTEGAVKSAVHRMRQSYGRLLREEIANTAAPDEVDDEVRHLLAVVRPWQS